MKVMIEISDDQVIAVLSEAIAQSWQSCQPKYLPARPHEIVNLVDSAEFCRAANYVIGFFGGSPVDLSTLSLPTADRG
jgi:hypothetical protein